VLYKIRLKTGEFSTNHLQFYNSIAEVVAAVFGDKKKDAPIKVNDMAPEQAVNELNNFFGQFGAI
jgi:hypothetical protein